MTGLGVAAMYVGLRKLSDGPLWKKKGQMRGRLGKRLREPLKRLSVGIWLVLRGGGVF